MHANKLFVKRKEWLNPPSKETCFEAAKKYLLEESAIWGALLNLGFDFINYPGKKNEAVEYTYNKLSQLFNQELPWLRYSFEKKRSSIALFSKKLIQRTESISAFQFFSNVTTNNVSTEELEVLELNKPCLNNRFSL